MYQILLRYITILLIASVAGAGGGYMAVKSKKVSSPPAVTQSGTLPAIPAQPFPGQGVPAIPAIPALPSKPDKTEENPIVSYLKSWTVDFGFNKQNEVTPGRWADVYSTNFDLTNNAIYWNDVAIGRYGAGLVSNYDGTMQQMHIPFAVPTNAELGSTHSISIKNSLGTSNIIQVRMVEAMDDLPVYYGVRPHSGPAGTRVEVPISPGRFSYPPLSAKSFALVYVPANIVKSGATGSAILFFPAPLGGRSGGSFTMPKEWIYCPSYLYSVDQCTLAPQNTKIVVPAGEREIFVLIEYDFQYAGKKRVSPLTLSSGQELGFRFKYTFGN